MALYRAGNLDEGMAEIDAALDAAPDNPRALYYKGSILAGTGDTEQAITLLERAASTDSPFADEAAVLLDSLQD
jgi:tetratricopeptide (TPR) repeat protein